MKLDPLVDPPTIASVTPESAADQAGLLVGDVVVQCDGRATEQSHQLLLTWLEITSSDPLPITI